MNDLLPYIVIGLTSGSIYGLAGIGLVLTYRTSGIFNFAHGAIAAVIGYAFYDLRERQGLPWPIAAAICLLVLAPLLGLLLEQIARRVAEATVVLKVVATVAVLVTLQQFLVLRYGAAPLIADAFLPTSTFRFLEVNIGYDQLIVMVLALLGTVGLTLLLTRTRLGRTMRAVVDRPDLLSLMSTSPVKVRRFAWLIGTMFAGLSGVLLVPLIGLEPTALTMLVVQAFGAAAIGMFTSLPLTYVGGLVIGVGAAISTKYVSQHPGLGGFPPSLPFIVLFVVLLAARRGALPALSAEQKPRLPKVRHAPLAVKLIGAVVAVLVIVRIPDLVGTRLALYTQAVAFAIIFLSLALLMRTANMVSLAQLSFAAVAAVVAARLRVEAGLPWGLAVLAGALVAVPIGALLAIPGIRRAGIYLALATFGFAILVERLLLPSALMYGGAVGALPAPRPSIATDDRTYFYVVVAIAVVAFVAVGLLLRSRLGRLLRAMADSQTALTTYGTSVNVLKVMVFCIAAFLAGLGGTLVGPITGLASPEEFVAFASLQLVVLLSIVHGAELGSAIGAGFAFVVVPSYLAEWFGDKALIYFPLFIALAALGAARRYRRADEGPSRLRVALASLRGSGTPPGPTTVQHEPEAA